MARDFGIFLFVIGIVLFNWPITSIFGQDLLKYFFIVWFIFILLIFVASRMKDKNSSGG